MKRLRNPAAVLMVWGLASLPRAAAACAVCVSGQEDRSTLAFRYTTAVLSLLPLGMVGGGVLWLRHRMRHLEAQQSAVDPARAHVSH